MEQQIKDLIAQVTSSLKKIDTLKKLDELKQRYLGKSGLLTLKLKDIPKLAIEDRARVGQQLNQTKKNIEDLFVRYKQIVLQQETTNLSVKDWIDVTIPRPPSYGSLHPISIVQYQLEDIFGSMGFTILDGPHIESDYYNFEALNFPADHPARDTQDTFYLSDNMLLRTQTSSIQIHAMEEGAPPLKIVGPGKVFRAERIDASHSSVFHQIEGMMIDRGINVANMLYFLQMVLSEIYQQKVKVRLRPGYFPFVEPGFEMDMGCLICDAKGCKSCKYEGWVEILGCGLMHPNVLRSGKINPEDYTGFAFGIGIDRLAMQKFSINDIRLLHGGELLL